MASIISTKTSGGGGIAVTGDTSGVLQLASNNGTTAVEIDASQVFKFNSGYGSVATAYGCRAWVNFNGTGTVAIRASGNVSSITDNGTGDYTVNFATALSDADYSYLLSIGATGPNTGSCNTIQRISTNTPSSLSIRVTTRFVDPFSTGVTDAPEACVSIFR
jgi:hypothetical protein